MYIRKTTFLIIQAIFCVKQTVVSFNKLIFSLKVTKKQTYFNRLVLQGSFVIKHSQLNCYLYIASLIK